MLKRILLTGLIIITSQGALSQNDVSKAYLARVSQLLSNTHVLIAQAHAYNNQRLREQFDYQKLDRDISKIETGISHYINERQIEPDHIKAVSGHYQKDES